MVYGGKDGLQKPIEILDRNGDRIHTGKLWDFKQEKHIVVEGTLGDRMLSAIPFDWDNDGDLDLLLGTEGGRLLLRMNGGTKTKPVFEEYNRIIRVEGKPLVVPHYHDKDKNGEDAKPVLADWNSDGLVDIVVGSAGGSVFWYPNIGEKGTPLFSKPRELVSGLYGGKKYPAGRVQVYVTDIDGDGDQDLIVGDTKGNPHRHNVHGHLFLYLRNGAPRPVKVKSAEDAESEPEETVKEKIEELRIKQLPEEVMQAALKIFPDLEIYRVAEELEDKKIVYSLRGSVKGAHYDVKISGDGQPISFETIDTVDEENQKPEQAQVVAQKPVAPAVGDFAPEISGVDVEGNALNLSDYRGKVVLLGFWGFW